MTTDLDAVRRDLTAKQRELDTELATLSAPTGDQSGISFGKRVGDGTSMAVERLSQVAAHEQLQDLRADVVRALAKLDEGSYGVCDRCGQPIAPGRLEALPWTALCIDDASKR
ncbi:MAG: TraR/DksA family transcriptional regulator [Actinomycetes bacterium]